MCSKNELLDDLQDQLIPKSEPIEIDFIKTEEFQEECFAVPGLVGSFEVDEDSVKEEILQNEENGTFSTPNVRISFLM